MRRKIHCPPPGHAIAGAAANGDARGARGGGRDDEASTTHCLTVYAETRVNNNTKSPSFFHVFRMLAEYALERDRGV